MPLLAERDIGALLLDLTMPPIRACAPGASRRRSSGYSGHCYDGDERSPDRGAMYARWRRRLSGQAGGRKPPGIVCEARIRDPHVACGGVVLEERLLTAPHQREAFAEIITQSKEMFAIFRYIEAVSPSPQPVLITGETGTGKELVARALPALGTPRRACHRQCGGPGRYSVLGYLVRSYEGRVYRRRSGAGQR